MIPCYDDRQNHFKLKLVNFEIGISWGFKKSEALFIFHFDGGIDKNEAFWYLSDMQDYAEGEFEGDIETTQMIKNLEEKEFDEKKEKDYLVLELHQSIVKFKLKDKKRFIIVKAFNKEWKDAIIELEE